MVYCRRPDGRRQAHPPPAARHRGPVGQAVRHPLQRRLDASQGSGRVPRPLRQARPQGRRRHHETAPAARRLRAYGGARRRLASSLRRRHLQGATSADRRATRGTPQGGKQGRTPQGGQPESQAKTWHKTDTDTDNPSPTPPAGKPKQPATPESGFDHFAEAYPGSVGAKGRKTEAEARALYAAIAGNPVELTRLQAALRRYKHAVNDGQIRSGHIPRLNTWLRDQWKTWAPEPVTPPPIHKHTWNCEHVHQLMDPHEDEYDHTGSLRNGNPSEWWKACQACADELNNQETSKEKQ